MRFVARICQVTLLFASVASAQVSTGTPLFSSIGGGPFDSINLGNLNIHFAVPVLHKAGRGVPFTYDLAYDSSVWTPVTSNGVTQWQPVGNWGWTAQTAATSGYVTAAYGTSRTGNYPTCYSTVETWSNYQYHDPIGRIHPFAGITTITITWCNNRESTSNSGPLVATATDGSGFSINTGGAGTGNWTITSAKGTVITGPYNSQNGIGTYTDANGNQVSVNSSGQYFDTLSSSTPVLTMAGSGSPTSPTTFTYVAPSGHNSMVTVNYAPYTVATNFGFTGSPQIKEYGPASVALVSGITLPDQTSYSFSYEATPGSCTPIAGTYPNNCVTGRIVAVTLPTGGSISYSYTGGPHGTGIFSDGSTAGIERTLSTGGTWSYSRSNLTGTPGPGSTWSTTITDPTGNATVSDFSEDSTVNGTHTVATYNLYETQRQTYQGSQAPSNLLQTVVRCFNQNFSSCAGAAVASPVTSTDTYTQLPNGATRLSELFYNGSYPGSGLVSDDGEYDFGVSQGAAPGTAHLIRQTQTSYASLNNGLVGYPSSINVYDYSSGSGVLLSSTSYNYDQTAVTATSGTPQHISISGSRGNLTTASYKTSSSSTLTRIYTYYDTGNLNTAVDVNGATITYGYGSSSCGNSFITSVAEPLNLSRSFTWNCTGGVETAATDENGQTVTASYSDPYFWRPANVFDQENNQTSFSYPGPTVSESALNFNGGQSALDLRATTDGFGRPILSQRLQGPGAGNYDTVETDYNNLGLPSRSTMPFSASAGGTNSSAPAVNTTYDALGRVSSASDANGGSTTYAYSNNDVLVTVSGGQSFRKQLEYDGLGRLSSVCEISTGLPGYGTCNQTQSQSGYWTKYTYDALGHLLTVTQNAQAGSGQQTRSYSYDMEGRMLQEVNPETGTETYTYDVACSTTPASAGDLTKKVDNAGNTTCFYYDALHRLSGGGYSTVCRRLNYDTSVTPPAGISVINTKTRLREAETDNCSGTQLTDEWFSYSARGELTDVYESTPHSNGYYHTTASYWPSGALETLSGIPSVPTISYGAGGAGLDGEGRYTQVSAGSGSNPVTGVTYAATSSPNPLGALTAVTYGSSDSDAFTYDPNTGRASSYVFSVNGSTDTGTTAWNANGTLGGLSINDTISGTADSQSCSFSYDDLGRSSGVNCGTAWQQSFSYDAFGNIDKSGSGSFQATYNSATNQFSLGGGGVSYDANGNLLSDNLNQYAWDPNWGSMTAVNGISATYDALGRVVEQGSGSPYTQILYSPVGKTALMNGTSLTTAFMPLPGGGTAIYNASGLAYYRHADWLGSSRLTSTASRTLDASTAYAPFGEQYATSGTPDPSFTGQNSDTVSSLYDFTFRRLSPSQGRWISPDPSGLAAVDPTTPQTWNRYAYVANNPLSFIDPLGLNRCGPNCSGCDPDQYNCAGGAGVGDSSTSGYLSGFLIYTWFSYGTGWVQLPNGDYSTTTYGTWQLTGSVGAGGESFVGWGGLGSGGSGGTASTAAPSKTTVRAACAADVAINYGLGFIPGYNGVKAGLALGGINLNFVQNGVLGTSFVSSNTPLNNPSGVGAVLWGANGLASTYNAVMQAAKNIGPGAVLNDVAEAASTAGTVANVINTVSALNDLRGCLQK